MLMKLTQGNDASRQSRRFQVNTFKINPIEGERRQFRMRVFQNEYFESLDLGAPGRIRVLQGPRIVDDQVGKVRLG